MKDQTYNQLGTVVGLSARAALGEVAITRQACINVNGEHH